MAVKAVLTNQQVYLPPCDKNITRQPEIIRAVNIWKPYYWHPWHYDENTPFDTNINMMPSSNWHDFWWMHKRIHWWFCNSGANLLDFFSRLRQRAKIKVWKISPKSVQFHSMKFTVMFKLKFEKNTLLAVHNGLMPKVNIFSIGNDHIHSFNKSVKIVLIG